MEFLRTYHKKIYCGDTPILLRGFGLGGWLLPEGYMWKLYTKCDRPRRMEKMIETLCGSDYARYFWQSYFDQYITEDDIALIKDWEFNSIRLPLNARHLNNEIIGRIDTIVDWCRKHHIYIILDMHGAPGGQTGQNIDDSEDDLPKLFMEEKYVDELVELWALLAEKYQDEPVIAAYDLLNEPLPNFFNQYNNQVLPLYRKLIQTIRTVDKKHIITLEGVHWATDFSTFDDFTREEASDNILLQFHKYWSNPDRESLNPFLDVSNRLDAPLFMGEGGENNYDWYTTAFPLYEMLDISWSFWSYKKMDCNNSPITFPIPKGWDELESWIDGKINLDQTRAIEIFDELLASIKDGRINEQVFYALKRQIPVIIPCEAYDRCDIHSEKISGANLRSSEPVSILFESGKVGEVDYKRHGGETQAQDENLVILISEGDSVYYNFYTAQAEFGVQVTADGNGELLVILDDKTVAFDVKKPSCCSMLLSGVSLEKKVLCLKCNSGQIRLDAIKLFNNIE